MEEMTDINGSMKTLAESTEREQVKPSAVAAEMGGVKPAEVPVEAPSAPVGTPPVGVATQYTPSIEGGQKEAVLTPAEKAAEILHGLRVIDGDTFDAGGERIRLSGADAFEKKQRFGAEASDYVRELLKGAKDVKIERKRKDVYGRTVADVLVDGVSLSKLLVEKGLGVPFGWEEDAGSNAVREAEIKARESGSGFYGVKDGSVNEPSGYRKSDFSAYQQEFFKRVCDMELNRMRKVMTPEAMEALAKSAAMDLKEKNEAYRKLVAKSAPVKGVAGIVAELGMLGFDWERRGVDVDDIPVYRLNWVLKRMQDEFGYKAADFANEGYKNPYDAARRYVKNAMDIIRTNERRQKRFRELSPAEQQQEMNEAFYGDAKEKYRWFGHEEVKSYMDSMTFKGVVEQAFENGMTAKEVVTAAFMALSEHQDENEHRARLSVMPIENAKKVASLAGALRAQYDGNAFAKGFLSFANSVEGITRNVKAVVEGGAFGVASESYILDVLSQGLEDTIIDNEDSFWGEVATVAGSSIPVMALLTVPKVGLAVYAANCYGEASRIPIQEDWHNADPVKTEVFKVTYAASAPFIEKGVLGLAMAPLSSAVKAGHIFGPRIAGMIGGKSLAMHLAGAETRGAMSKIAKGITLTTNRSLVSAYGGEIFEEVAEQAILDAGGAFVDPTSAEGKKLYGLERFANGIIDAAWTSIKTGPFLTFPFAAGGVLREGAALNRQVDFMTGFAQKLGDKRDVLEIRQEAVNTIAALNSKMRAKTLGGLKSEELAPFYVADTETRKRMLEETQDKDKRRWLGEVDLYLRYKEDFEKRSFAGDEGAAEDIGPAEKPKPKTSPASKIREAAANPEEERGSEGGTETGTETETETGTETETRTETSGAQEEGTERTEGTEGAQEEKPEAKPESESFEDGTPVPDTKNPPRREGGENGVPEKGGRTGTPHAEADTGDSSQTGGGVKPVEGNKEEQGGTKPKPAVPIEKRRGAAKEFSEKIGVLVKSLEEMAKGAGLKVEDASDFVESVKQVAAEVLGKHGLDGRGAKEVSRLVRLAEKAVEGYSKSNNAAEFGKVIDEAKKLLEWSNKPSRKRKVPTSNINARALYSEFENVAEAKLEEEKPKVPAPKNEAPRPTFRSSRRTGFRQTSFVGSRFSIGGFIRALSPEVEAAFGGSVPEGVTLNPSLVEAFKSAIEESERTGVGIMSIFAKVYGRELLGAVSDMEAHKAFVEDPFGWAEAMVDKIVELARRADDGDEKAEDDLERLYFGSKTFEANARRTGKVEEHPHLRPFAEFAKKWLQSVFGEGANIYFIEELDGSNAEQLQIMGEFENRKRAGEKVNAALVTGSGNVYVSREANPIKVLHEVLGHATWQWMKKNDAKGYAMLREAAINAPQHIKELVRANYGELNPNLKGEEAEAEFDAYLDEIFAHLMEAKYSKRVASLFAKKDDRAWYERVWSVISAAVAKIWKSVFGDPDADTVEGLLDSLSTRFFNHGGIFMKSDSRNEGGLRFSKYYYNQYDDPRDIARLRRGENVDSQYIGRIFGHEDVEDVTNAIEEKVVSRSKSGNRKLQEERDANGGLVVGESASSVEDENGGDENTNGGDRRIVDALDHIAALLNGAAYSEDASLAGAFANNPGFEIVDFMSGAKSSYLGKDGGENEFSLLYEFSNFEKGVSESLRIAGIDYKKLQSEDKSREELSRYLSGKSGLRKEIAKHLINVFKFVSAIPEMSRTSFDESTCARLQKEIDEANRLADEAFDATEGTFEEKRKAFNDINNQISAAEQIVSLMVENSGTFLAAKSVFGLYISRLRPNARRIGKSENDLTQSDFSVYGVDEMDVREVSGKSGAALLQDQDFDTVEDLDIALWSLVGTYDAVQAFKGVFKSLFENSENPYVGEAARRVLEMVAKAEKVANEEWKYVTSPTRLASGKALSRGNAMEIDSDFAEYGKGGMSLPEWIAARVKDREERAKYRMETASATWKRKYGSAGSEHEYQAKRMLKLKSVPKEGMLWVVRYLEADDDLRRAPKDRVNPRLRNSKAKPLDDATRKELDAKIRDWLKPGEPVKPKEGESQEEYDRRVENQSARNRIKALRHLYLIGYERAKKRGEIYGDSAEWEALRAAKRAYSELLDIKTFVHPRNPVPDIDARIEAARKACEDAQAAYDSVSKMMKEREPHNIARAIAAQSGRILAKESDLDSIDRFRARVVTIIKERFGGDISMFYEDYNVFGGIGEEILRLKRDLENGDTGARAKIEAKQKSLAKAIAAFGDMARSAKAEAESEIDELGMFWFDEKKGIYTRRSERESTKENEAGSYDSMPRGLRAALRKNRKLGDKRVLDEKIILDWVFSGKDGARKQVREWVGLFDTMTPQTYNLLRESANDKVESYVKYNIVNKQLLGEHQASQGIDVDAYLKSSGVSEEALAPDERRSWAPKRSGYGSGVRFSKENAENTAEPNPVPKFRAKQYSKTIDFAAAFLMRMLADGSYDLDEKLCRNIAYTLDPYMGGETLKGCIEAAKILAKIVRNEPGVEKLSDDELLDLVVSKVETIKEDLLSKLAEAVHDVQTDTWKAIAESYRARLERYERTGRDEEYGTLSIEELRKLGITSEGTSSNLSSDGSTKQRLTKDSFKGLNRKVYKLLFGADWPRREDYDNDEDFAKAKKAYALKVKSTATPEVLAKYRNTLVWLYGKYGTDSWLRRFFQPSAAAQVRMLVGKLRDTADTVEDIFLFAERIETILSQSQRNLSTEAMVDSIRTMIEPFLKDADPRTALKKRKISPKALEFLKAVYEGMAELTDEKLIAMMPDVRGLSETDLKAKIGALRAEVIAKKADEAAKESEDEGALGGDKKPNAVRAIAALSRQAGYRLVLPYLRLNGRGEDVKNPERTPIQIREEMDKIYAETARVIAEGTQEVKDHIKEQDAMIESFLDKVISALSKGKSGKVNNSATKESALNEILKKFGALTVSGFSLKQRLAELLRYADEDTRSELSALFDEFINTPVAKAESDQSRYYLRAREAMNRMILKVYSGSKNAGVGEVAAILQMLNTQMDELARFSEDGQTPLTRAQVMAQIAMLRQESVQAPVAELARKLKTGEMVRTKAELTEEMAARGVKVLADQDRAMLKRLEQLDDMIATLDKLSDGKDLKLIDEMVRYYAELAPRIDATAMKITGMAVTTGETGFFPVRRSSEWASRSTERSNRVIGLVPDYLSPRRNTTTDIAQDADIFSIFSDQAEKNAHFLAFGELHYRLSALFENGDWSHLTNRILGKEGAKMLKDHVQDVCAPNLIFIDNSGDNSFWSMARKWVSIALLGGNVLVAAKQMTSVSAFAHEIGWARLAKAAMSNPLSEEMRAARKELFESPEARMRWGDVWLSVQDAVMSRPGKKAKVAAAFAYYMSLQRLGDKVPSWFVAPAVYLANYNALRSRVNPDTGAPFTESEAKARAREMVFDMIEKTQQTSRVSDMAHSQRRGQALGQLWTQFMSSSILFFSSEARAIRDAAANPKNLDSWKRLTGIIVSNHIVTPTLLKGAELLAKKLLQGEDPDDDDLESWIAMLCAGPLSGLVVLGNILTNDRYGDVSAPTVSFFGRVVKNLKKLSVHTVTGEFDEALGDVHKLIASLFPAYRDGSKLYKTYIKTYIEED